MDGDCGSLNFDLQNIDPAANDDEEEKEALEEARQKEKELQEALATAFDDLSYEYDDDDDENDEESDGSEKQSHAADEENGISGSEEISEGQMSSHTRSKNSSTNSEDRASGQIQNGEYNVGTENNSKVSFTDFEQYDFEASEDSYIAAAKAIGQRYKDLLALHHIPEEESCADDSSESVRRSSGSGTARNHDYQNGDLQTEYEAFEDVGLKNNVEDSGSGIHVVNGEHNNVNNNQNTDMQALKEEMIKLDVLYNARGKEIQRLKKEMENSKSEANNEIKILKYQLAVMEGEKDGLLFSLQQSQSLLTDKSQTCSTLEGKLNAVEFQLSAERQAKEEVMKKLEATETTMKSLELQVTELSRSENLARAREQHEAVVNNLKQRHQQEALELKQEIDGYKKSLDLKATEVDSLHHQLKQFEQKYQHLRFDKAEAINRLTASLEASQHQVQELLESGTVCEISKVKMQLQHVLEEKTELEKKNKDLKEEIELMASELKSLEAVRILEPLLNDNSLDDSAVQLGLKGRKPNSNRGRMTPVGVSLQKEWERALNTLRSQRATIASLKDQRSIMQKELSKVSEKAKDFERRTEVAEKLADEYKQKVNELCPAGSVPVVRFQKELSALENDKAALSQELEDIKHRLKEISESEEQLNEINRQLREEMSDMVRQHDEDKQMSLQRCRESCLQMHEAAMATLKSDLTSQAENEMKKLQFDYENEIISLRKEISTLNDALHEVKTQYIDMCQNTKYLQENCQELDQAKIKSRKEIEAKLQKEFEAELLKIQVELERQKKEFFESKIQEEVSKEEKRWVLKKTVEVKKFIDGVKKQLEDQFDECLKKEKEIILSNAEKEYETKLAALKKQWAHEKLKALEDLKKNLLAQWSEQRNDLEKRHEMAMQTIIDQRELRNAELEKLEKEQVEKIKAKLLETEKELKDKLSTAAEIEAKLKEKVKKYSKHVEKINSKHKEEVARLKSDMLEQLSEIKMQKESELKAVEENHAMELQTTEKYYKELISKREVKKSNSHSQTDEVLVPKHQVLQLCEITSCVMKKIQEDIVKHLVDSRRRATERLQLALTEYHRHLFKNLLQNTSRSSSVSTANSHSHQEVESSGFNTTFKKSKSKAVQHSTVHRDFISPTLLDTVNLASVPAEDSVNRQVQLVGDRTKSDACVTNANLDNSLASGDGCQVPSDVLEILDISTERFDLPQQQTAFNLLTQALKPPKYLSPALLNGDLQEAINSYFPERLSPKSQKIS